MCPPSSKLLVLVFQEIHSLATDASESEDTLHQFVIIGGLLRLKRGSCPKQLTAASQLMTLTLMTYLWLALTSLTCIERMDNIASYELSRLDARLFSWTWKARRSDFGHSFPCQQQSRTESNRAWLYKKAWSDARRRFICNFNIFAHSERLRVLNYTSIDPDS